MQELKHIEERHVVEFKEFMILKNFSKRTIKTYSQIVLQFLNWWRTLEGAPSMNDDDRITYYITNGRH